MTLNIPLIRSQSPTAAKGEVRSCEPDTSPAQRAMAPLTALKCTSVYSMKTPWEIFSLSI